ncbi:MAG: glycosyltransferase family 39 protein, partial [Clostridia bacterium]|nr:glycosyltransferase family 39 protein [Clostridia bacterium]
ASINNDMLAILFLAIAVLYLIRWLKRQSFKNSILLALAIGFGMMTKMSVAIIAPVAAVVFAFVFFRRLKSHTGMELIPKFAAFLGICVPLGLWYPLRNWFLFRQSPGYVLLLSTDQPIYMGGHSIVQRFLSLPFATEMFARGRIFGDPARDYNIFMFLIKSSVLGEWDWSFEKLGTLAGQLVIANMLLIAVSLIAAAYVLIRARDKESRLKKALFALIWLSEMAFYVEFNLSYPFGCSMDFRYIVITVIVGAAFIGMAYDHVMHRHPRLPSAALVAMLCPLLLFTFSSVLFYTVI